MHAGVEKLRAQRERKMEELKKVEERLKKVETREAAKERKRDTRRKVLLGAMVLEKMKSDPTYDKQTLADLDRFLIRKNDRALFGLETKSETTTKP